MPIVGGIYVKLTTLTRTLITDYAARLIAKGSDSQGVIHQKIMTKYKLSTADNLPVSSLIRDAQRIRYAGTYLNSDRGQSDTPSTQFPQKYGPKELSGIYEYTVLVTRRNNLTGETTTHSERVRSLVPLSLDRIEGDVRSGKREFTHTPSPPVSPGSGQPQPTYTITVSILTAGQIRA